MIIGGEGALVLGGLAAARRCRTRCRCPANVVGTIVLCIAGAIAGGLWIALAGWLRQYRGINETISSLLLAYIAIGVFKHLVEGPLRDPASLNKPSTRSLVDGLQIGGIGGSDVHWGLVIGVVACLLSGLWLRVTAARLLGARGRRQSAHRAAGRPAGQPADPARPAGSAARCAGMAGAVEVAAVHTNANASLIAGYGYAGILVSFIARHNPVAVIPVAILFGGFGAAGSLLQRRLGLPDASVLVLQGIAFVLILASEGAAHDRLEDAAQNRMPRRSAAPTKEPHEPRRAAPSARTLQGTEASHDRRPVDALLFAAIVGGALRVGAPFLFVSLGECLTEKSGRINLGLEGVLVLSAMASFGGSYLTGSPWLGVLIGAAAGAALALLHGLLCSLTASTTSPPASR